MTAASPEETALLPRLESVLGVLAAGNRFALAYSGGLDSRFLAHAAQRFGFEPVLLHIVGPHIPPEETDYARHWAASRELAYEELPADPLDLALVASGDRRRCYACKRNLFSLLKARTDLPLCDGTNASDAGQYRPGIRAVEELGILSPLASAGLTKADIHRCAALTGMEDPEQKARPCLLTRLPYGMKPERSLLAGLAAGERAVHGVFASAGLPGPDFRLRLVDAERLELHVLPEPALAPGLCAELAAALPKPFPSFRLPVWSRWKRFPAFSTGPEPFSSSPASGISLLFLSPCLWEALPDIVRISCRVLQWYTFMYFPQMCARVSEETAIGSCRGEGREDQAKNG